MQIITITTAPELEQPEGDQAPAADWSITQDGDVIDGGRWSAPAPALGAISAAVLALVELERPESAPADAAAALVLAFDNTQIAPADLARVLGRALRSDAAPLVAAALVAAGAWPLRPLRSWGLEDPDSFMGRCEGCRSGDGIGVRLYRYGALNLCSDCIAADEARSGE